MPAMRSLVLLCVLIAVPAFAAGGADLSAAERLRDHALKNSRAAELVESLVATAPFRFTGSAQDAKAVAWALNALKQAGLQNVRAEPVTVPYWQRGDINIQLLGDKPQPLMAVALGGSVTTPAEGITASVLMLDSLDALYARPLADVKGKIVFINRRMERRADGSGYGEAKDVRVKGAAEAGRRGARAVVIRSIGTNHDRVPHTGWMRYDSIAPKIPAAALSAVDADLLEQVLLDQGEARLHLHLNSRDLGMAQSANVIGEIPGLSKDVVVLAAHLDSWDITPGANDDGAGVAIVIEAAHSILATGLKPRRTIRVLLAANEEFGLSGAKAYAKAHAAELGRHVLALEADFGSGAVQSLNAGVADADWPQIERMAALLQPLGVTLGKNGQSGGADLGPMRLRGVPVLAPRQDGTRYFDVHHTAADTLETLDRPGLAQNVAVYAVLAWMASEAEAFVRLPVLTAD